MFEHCESWRVVISLEDQYSVWPKIKAIPPGWSEVGKEGNKEECLSYIKEVWVDMRTRSLKELMGKNKMENEQIANENASNEKASNENKTNKKLTSKKAS